MERKNSCRNAVEHRRRLVMTTVEVVVIHAKGFDREITFGIVGTGTIAKDMSGLPILNIMRIYPSTSLKVGCG